jgi:hypothetical protein
MCNPQRTRVVRAPALRFGELSETVRKRVARADSEALERWAERVLTATSLTEVFARPGSRS